MARRINMADKLKTTKVNSKGFGTIPKMVMRDKDLTIESKAIYAYLASFSGAGDTAYPSVGLMCDELNISRDRYYRHREHLIEKNYIEVNQRQNEAGWSNNIYTLVSEPCPYFKDTQDKDTQNKDTQDKDTQNKDTIINSSIINSSITNSTNKSSPDSANAKYDDDSPYVKLAVRLHEHIKQRNPKQKEPNWQTWADDFRKTVKLDDRELNEVAKVLDWCQKDDFWQNNVLSPAKFRKQYDQLFLKMTKETGYGGSSYGGLEF